MSKDAELPIRPQSDDDETVTLDDKWRLTIPQKLREQLPWKQGWQFWAYLGYGPKITFELAEGPKYKDQQVSGKEKLKSFKHELAIASLVMLAAMIFVTPAFAQTPANPHRPVPVIVQPNRNATVPVTPVVTPTNTTSTTSPLPQPGQVLTIGLDGRAAYYPLRIVLTYPTGESLIQNVSAASPSSVFDITHHVNTPAAGVTSTEFTTGVADTFNLLLGERYHAPVNQIAQWTIYSNNEQIDHGSFPVPGSQFMVLFQFTTSPAPHIPTADELNAGVYTRIDNVQQSINRLDTKADDTNNILGSAANAFGSSAGIMTLFTLIGILNLAIMFQQRRTFKAYTKGTFNVDKTGSKVTQDTDGRTWMKLAKKKPTQQEQTTEQALARLEKPKEEKPQISFLDRVKNPFSKEGGN